MTTRSNLHALAPGVAPALSDLVRRVRESRFPLQTADAQDGRALQRDIDDQLTDYLLPRVSDTDAPLLVVVGGSTGAGKSTLVNSIIGSEVSNPGVLRPTTRWPVLVHNPEDREYFTSDRILPTLRRVVRAETDLEQPQVRLVAHEGVPRGLALLDSPDIDSVLESNRTLARQLLAAADLWLFVTTAARYADAVPWELLKTSVERGTTVAMVLDRVPPQANREVRHHLSGLLSDSGLGSAPIFTIPELELTDGLLPDAAVFPVRSWILNLGMNATARDRVISRTLTGALAAVPAKVRELADIVSGQEDAHQRLHAVVDEEFGRSAADLAESLADGRVLRGEVLARWQDFVGTGQFFRGLEPTVARVRDRITAAVTGKRDAAESLEQAIESSVALLIREQTVRAVAETAERWQAYPEGAALVDERPAMATLPPQFDAEVGRMVADWSSGVNDLVREVGQSKRAKARILSFGVNGVGAVLMLAVFAGTGGLTGAEAGIAGGTAVVAGKLLDTIFGDQVTRDLAQTAREQLVERARAVLERHRAPFDQALADTEVPPRQAGVLRGAGDRLEETL
ncbi:dynamin family protein [Brevibacterium sp. CS2]|uniref:dynamin family protein n=1 Tax=Brevibacterium sp. CS2 TaxID=2575923 RepID=UPI0020C7B849|nr:dynamin family protein [Brevibacterium sp. CS2]